jgi:serine/threonine protein kinase
VSAEPKDHGALPDDPTASVTTETKPAQAAPVPSEAAPSKPHDEVGVGAAPSPDAVAHALSDTRVSPGVEPGTVLANKFRVERVLASGGMGIIFVAHHLQLDQRVAIKVLRTHVLDDPEIVARFAREARVAAKIKSEHVVRVIDVGALPNGAPYMVMEHLQGSDLSALLKARGPIPVDEAVEYVLQACEALAEAHLAGVVHRDLKPANLFLTRRADGSPLLKVLDFGISKVVEPLDTDSAMTKTSMIMGSPHYMSPEQLRSARKVDGRADIWALGVVLYRLIVGKNPFQAETTPELCVEILHGKPVPLLDVVPEAPKGLSEVIEGCLQKKPDKRYANVAKLARALEPFANARARASVDRISGVYRAAPPVVDSAPSVRSAAEPARAERQGRASDATDLGARTVSEKSESVAASVSDNLARRRRSPVLIGLGLVAVGVAGGAFGLRYVRGAPTSASAVPVVSTVIAPAATAPAAPASTAVAAPSETPAAAPSASAPVHEVVRTRAHHHLKHAAPSASATAAAPPKPSAAPSSDNPQSKFGGPF